MLASLLRATSGSFILTVITRRQYGQFFRCNMHGKIGRREQAIVEELRQIFAAQFSNIVLQEIRKVEELHKTPIPAGEQKFTVMSYNVLAQDLIENHRGLYPTQDPEDLKWENRKKKLIGEIKTQNPDILAMQEVQQSHIPLFYNDLEKIGYKGVFKRRTENNTDGVAVYYKTDVFDLVFWTSVEYYQPGIEYLNRPNVGLIVRLKLRQGNGELFLANTHLLYNPKRWKVRLAQTQILLTELHRIIKMAKTSSPALLLMGDLNSRPGSPVVRFLESGFVRVYDQLLPLSLGILNNCTHLGESKLYNSDYTFHQKTNEQPNCRASPSFVKKFDQCPGEALHKNAMLEAGVLSHNFNFSSVYNLTEDEKYGTATTHHDKWVTVDYMFYSNLRLLSRLRLPTVDECKNFVQPMPNRISPSDHFPLLATFSML
ncbi:protein angel homolog 2 isoform X1 [Cimex lectularius]|uniref:Endonuclease/exonuclease/phosphatase domain-containing protein n=1 Tax=Cimex lectularius TaxID=79782 RepID=A0A8I6R6M3_CIMLE|nr:protein angel homolog 2 isoform X1 [Cimex lectularius]XP_014239932.1 protein angel homolog 2 isoform X1 [Cimex lectularius]XP_014239933.1 protein angel homolog 2 isoform X1 [Cimex lectularius]